MLLSLIGFISFVFISNLHPFHVSVCEVYHNQETNSLEISMKIFIDDLELAIQHNNAETFRLSELHENNDKKDKLVNYLKKQFLIMVNSKEINLEFVGFEFDDDALLCYMEGKKINKIATIEIKNALITELYEDQINLTHFQYHGEMKSIKTVREQPSGIIVTSGW